LYGNIEGGDLAIQDLKVDKVRLRTWPQMREFAVWIAGPNPAVRADAPYGVQHYEAALKAYGKPFFYETVVIDSVTRAGGHCFEFCKGRPEAFSSSGKPDLRSAYGLHAREMCAFFLHLQQALSVNVVYLGILETVTDEFGKTEHRLQMEGSRTGRELPSIVDEVITMHWIKNGNDMFRAFICTAPNQWNYPAKDRSGRLDQIEQPHLGKLLDKLTRPSGELVAFPSTAESAKE
jgi:hypothetical protein